jgi:gliding motility-associated-like protein
MTIRGLRFMARLIAILVIFTIGNSVIHAQDLCPVEIEIDCETGNHGDILCIDFDAICFESVSSMQFTINYDPSVVEFLNIDYTNSDFPNLESTGPFNTVNSGNGYILFIYSSESPVTLNPNDNLFSMCFELVGNAGTTSPVFVDGSIISGGLEICQELDNQQLECSSLFNGNIGCVNIVSTDLIAYLTKCDQSDDGANDGSITFYATGGTGPYTYSVMPGGFTGGMNENEKINIDNLSGPTIYTVTITDALGATYMVSGFVEVNFPVTFDLIELQDPTCFKRQNGFIEIGNIMGGFSPYTIRWEPNLRNTARIQDLANGDYTVTVMDAGGCSASASYTLDMDTLRATATIIDSVACNGVSNGRVKITATGGTPSVNGYQFTFDNFSQGFSPMMIILGGVSEGTHSFRVSDSLGCFTDIDFIDMPAKEFQFGIDFNITNPLCNGDGLGAVEGIVNIPGNFFFNIIDALPGTYANSSNFFNSIVPLPGGVYEMTIRQNGTGCELDTFFEIIEPELLVLDTLIFSQPTCQGFDGTISVFAEGGTQPYMYEWEDMSMDSLRTGLDGGMYTVTVTDANGCIDSLKFTLNMGGELNVNALVTQAISCQGEEDGTLLVNYNGSGGTFNWEDSDGMNVGNTSTINGLGAGTYYVTVTADGCSGIDSTFLIDPETFDATFTDVIPSCIYTSDGTLTIMLEGGAMPYTYEWYNTDDLTDRISSQSVANGLVSGEYFIKVTDLSGCVYDTTLILGAPPAINGALSGITNVSCYNGSNGTATVNASGGNSPNGDYFFTWSNGSTSSGLGSQANNLTAGANWVIIEDENQCLSDTITFIINEPAPLIIDLDASTLVNPDCGGICNGRAFIVAQGGNPGTYLFNWLELNSNSPLQQDLCAGTYHIEITDQQGCKNIDSLVFEQVEPLIANINDQVTQDINCFDTNGGTIGIEVSGGTPGTYEYFWTPNISNGPVATGLGEGVYQIIITDETNCLDTVQYTLTQPIPVEAVVSTPADIACFGQPTCIGIEDVIGGTGSNYTFTINNGTLFPVDSCVTVFAGEYEINVFDGDGCAFNTSILIDQPGEVEVDLGDDIIINLGLSTEDIEADIYSDSNIDTLVWSPNEFLECVNSDCSTVIATPPATITYQLTVTDENGCTGFDDIIVEVNNERILDFPNAFSPNGDAYNDQFDIILGRDVSLVNNLSIFDRWGNLVFSRNDFEPVANDPLSWNGKFNGNDVADGVYVYYIKVQFIDGVIVDYSGDITVIR